jgi:hypothetical protein
MAPSRVIENRVQYYGASHDYAIGMAGIAGSLAYAVRSSSRGRPCSPASGSSA